MDMSNEKLLELALMSMGPQYKEITLDQLEAALTRRILLIKSAIRPNSSAMRAFEAQNIIGVVRHVEHEATSNRIVSR